MRPHASKHQEIRSCNASMLHRWFSYLDWLLHRVPTENFREPCLNSSWIIFCKYMWASEEQKWWALNWNGEGLPRDRQYVDQESREFIQIAITMLSQGGTASCPSLNLQLIRHPLAIIIFFFTTDSNNIFLYEIDSHGPRNRETAGCLDARFSFLTLRVSDVAATLFCWEDLDWKAAKKSRGEAHTHHSHVQGILHLWYNSQSVHTSNCYPGESGVHFNVTLMLYLLSLSLSASLLHVYRLSRGSFSNYRESL